MFPPDLDHTRHNIPRYYLEHPIEELNEYWAHLSLVNKLVHPILLNYHDHLYLLHDRTVDEVDGLELKILFQLIN